MNHQGVMHQIGLVPEEPAPLYHKHCHHCGRFVERLYWIDANTETSQRPVCPECMVMEDNHD